MAPKKTRASERSFSHALFLLDVAAEAEAHGGEHLVLEEIQTARREPLEERGGQHVGWHATSFAAATVHRPSPESETLPPNLSRPGSLASACAVRSSSQELMTLPRAPQLGNVGEVEVVLVVLGVPERRRFRVLLVRSLADVGVLQDVEALAVGRHQPVLDPVVDHLHEVAGAGGPAVQVAVLGGAAELLAARRARNRRRGRARAS